MSSMDHAAAHEQIEGLLLEPARLAALATSREPADVALRDHLASCAVCRAELEGWQELQHRLAVALPGSEEAAMAAVEPVEVPPSLRAAVVAAARAADRSAAPAGIVRATGVGLPKPVRIVDRRPGRSVISRLAIAASILVLVGSVAITVDQVSQRSAAEAQSAALSRTVAAVDRVLAAPDHRVVGMKDPAGAAGGSISWSSHDLVVLTTALEPPPDGQRYACWLLEGDTSASRIGTMYFAGRTAYWVGSLDEWATFRIGPNTRFAVTLQGAADTPLSGPIYLSADLGT